jgi:hypothetical protein
LKINEYYQHLVTEHGRLDLEDLLRKQYGVVTRELNTAHHNAYLYLMQKASQFKWKDVEDYEELLLKAERHLFEKEISSQIHSNDPES